MAPYVQDIVAEDIANLASPKPFVLDHDNVPKPVADDFMYDFKYNHPLPTKDVLGIDIPADCDAQKEAEGIVSRLTEATAANDADAFTSLFLEHGGYPSART